MIDGDLSALDNILYINFCAEVQQSVCRCKAHAKSSTVSYFNS